MHADETGWRENGVNGCVWTFSTPTERRFLRRAGGCSSRGQLALEKRLLGLCRRIERHIKEMFVFVSHLETPPDNNAAERSLRHLVISRKISGGTRSAAGSKMTL